MRRMRDWAQLARMSNLPTCVTNVLVGLVLAVWVQSHVAGLDAPPRDWTLLRQLLLEQGGLFVIIAICLFYVAGMILNDVVDRDLDRIERPERPIPSGRIDAQHALLTAVGQMALGLLGLWYAGGWATLLCGGVLVAAIVLYNLLHQSYAWSVVLMGFCRTMVYLVAASISSHVFTDAWWQLVLPLAVITGAYTVGITVIARAENIRHVGRRRWAAVAMPIGVLLAAGFVMTPGIGLLWSAIAAVALCGWLGRAAWHVFEQPPRTKAAVLAWLSGLCLVDAWYLTLLNVPGIALAAAACFGITVLLHRRIMGT